MRIHDEYNRCCEVLGVKLPLKTTPQHDGSAHIEYHDKTYFYVITERGMEFERRSTTNEDEVLYWILSSIVFSLACQYELKNRIQGQSFRRLLFSKQLELMGLLNPQWQERLRAEIASILEKSPYDDAVEG